MIMDESSQNDQGQQTDTTNGLISVKTRALQELLSSLPSLDDINPEKKFDIYLSAISSTSNNSAAEHALEIAMSIEDKNKKAELLSSLVDEIDYKLATLK